MSRASEKGARIARRLVRKGRSSAPATARGERAPLAETGRTNPMQRSPDRRTWTGSSLSIAAPGLFPPSVLATWGEAVDALAVGGMLAAVTIGLLVLTWRLARSGERTWPAVFGLVGVAVGLIAVVVLLFGVAIGECAPDAYECPV
jgi:hypothetical protein